MQRYSNSPYAVIRFLFDLLQTFLMIRLLLLFFEANAANGIVQFFYTLTSPFVLPFRSIAQATVIQGWTIDWPTVIAMIAYAILCAIVIRIVELLVAPIDDLHRPA